jgi:hypothetical protein
MERYAFKPDVVALTASRLWSRRKILDGRSVFGHLVNHLLETLDPGDPFEAEAP